MNRGMPADDHAGYQRLYPGCPQSPKTIQSNKVTPMPENSLQQEYDHDYYRWLLKNTQLLRAGRFNEIDAANIAEELESMGKRDRRQLINRLIVLLTHLLKWAHQPEAISSGWKGTIKEQRRRLNQLLTDSPSLNNVLEEQIPSAWLEARDDASEETGLAISTFPERCPWYTENILDGRWFPGDG